MPRRIEAIEGGCGILTKRAITGIAMLSLAGLAGCNTGSTLDLNSGPTPAGSVPGGQAESQQPTDTALALQTDTSAASATTPLQSVTTSERIQFAPVIGATSEAVPALSRRLEARARQSGIPIVPQGGSASMVMKGYFSAIADGGKTTVIYVWDVLDPSGNRLHRIQGQQAAPGGQGDGWSSVTSATMEAVADSTISQLSAWLAQRQG
ncbi:hypothetical protein ACFPOD_10020 [Nitratireductor kimnyeongensis]|uniref:Lipoprotein n=1 Tax=Nitratireductor kimnyeongensis TaxID=430679 RepID=A0ABW0TA35_9HYPH|nr:hypothetical protein [Nitratireductor kimnyeongensis]QZZ36087.1 hypothetical protein KW403_02745 [Nitratireductor kimnyeongensis]